jgi:hypothetical protein
MKTTKRRIATAISGVAVLATISGLTTQALANLCTTTTGTWDTTATCGATYRGYATGSTAGSGLKTLEAQCMHSEAYEVSAYGRNSANQVLNNCLADDWGPPDGFPSIVSGGQCQQAVKFTLNIGYYQ